jgi:G protein-coupled glucose receptor regulating Gpa2 C-term
MQSVENVACDANGERPFNHQAAQRPIHGTQESARKRMNNVSLTLLCYPIAYICLIMPITLARIAEFADVKVSIPVIYFAAGVYASSGYVNVILYTFTRKGIVSWDWVSRLVSRRSQANSSNNLC